MGEPDYRQVRLHWEVDSSKTTPGGFSIRYCELQTWGFQRCRVQQVPDFTENAVVDKEEDIKIFNTDIKGLRMATTYSFEVKAVKQEKGEREDRADGDDKNQNIIVIPTKGCKYFFVFFFFNKTHLLLKLRPSSNIKFFFKK